MRCNHFMEQNTALQKIGSECGIDVKSLFYKYKRKDRQRLINNTNSSSNGCSIKSSCSSSDSSNSINIENGFQEQHNITTSSINNYEHPLHKNCSEADKQFESMTLCENCQGRGLVKMMYNHQIREINCDSCNGCGLYLKVGD